MTTKWKTIICVSLLWFGLAATCLAQQEQAQDRALAIRAARLDAMRQLMETIEGLNISASTQVKDFITESDEVQAFLTAFLQDAQQIGQVRYCADGTCEVTMAVSLDEVIQFLQEAWQHHPSKKISSAKQFEQIRHYSSQKKFVATGRGGSRHVPRQTSPANIWDRVHPRGKLMALRAAQVDAYRNLAETIKGIQISSRTTVRDFVTESDEILTAFNEFISGIETVGTPRYRTDGVVEVTAQVRIDKVMGALAAMCKTLYNGRKWNLQAFEKLSATHNNRLVQATGLGVPPAKYVFQEASEDAMYPKIVPSNTPSAKINHNQFEKSTTTTPLTTGKSTPEWTTRTLRVKGVGTFFDSGEDGIKAEVMAKRAAKQNGYRQLEGLVMSLKLNASMSVFDLAKRSPDVETKIKEAIKKARVRNYHTLDDGSIEVDMDLALDEIWQQVRGSYQNSKE